MDTQGRQLLIITGPNMAGKSTYLRQVAPDRINGSDRVFLFRPARRRSEWWIGSSPESRPGQYHEGTKHLHGGDDGDGAHSKSGHLEGVWWFWDEIGRGTSTFDGLSIALAVAEYLHDHPLLRPKTLFATHYHELTELALTKERVKNYNVAVKEWGGEIIFPQKDCGRGNEPELWLFKWLRLAGLPAKVIDRAKEISFEPWKRANWMPWGCLKIATDQNSLP